MIILVVGRCAVDRDFVRMRHTFLNLCEVGEFMNLFQALKLTISRLLLWNLVLVNLRLN